MTPKVFPMRGIVIALICIPLDINPYIIKRDGRFRKGSDIYAGTYCMENGCSLPFIVVGSVSTRTYVTIGNPRYA